MTQIQRFLPYLWSTICGEKMPVWLALLLIVLGAFGTYAIAPKLNEGFQIQVAKREFMVDSMKDFATTTKSFIDGVGKLVNENQPSDELKISLVSKAAKLNFFAVQLTFIIPEKKNLLLKFQESVEDVQKSVARVTVDTQRDVIITQLKDVSVQSLLIYQALAKKAGLGN